MKTFEATKSFDYNEETITKILAKYFFEKKEFLINSVYFSNNGASLTYILHDDVLNTNITTTFVIDKDFIVEIIKNEIKNIFKKDLKDLKIKYSFSSGGPYDDSNSWVTISYNETFEIQE